MTVCPEHAETRLFLLWRQGGVPSPPATQAPDYPSPAAKQLGTRRLDIPVSTTAPGILPSGRLLCVASRSLAATRRKGFWTPPCRHVRVVFQHHC